MSKTCSCPHCKGIALARGLCSKHYQRLKTNGTTDPARRECGTGAITKEGYFNLKIDGKTKGQHVIEAETALGKELPPGAVVHHNDGEPSNNQHSNLVICENKAYHNLLHQRQRSLKESGHANWRKCSFCKQYDDTSVMYTRHNSGSYHLSCKKDYDKIRHSSKEGQG